MPSFWGLANTLEADFDLTELAWSSEATSRFWEAVNGDPHLMPVLLARRGVGAVARARPNPPFVEALFPTSRRPFASCVSRIVRVKGGAGWVEAVRSLPRDHLLEAAFVEQTEVDFPAEPSLCRVAVTERKPGRLRFAVVADGPGSSFVAINQTWDEGWGAALDGAAVALVRTDLSLSGVVVPAGSHEVELTYRDRSITWGLAISGFSAFVTILVGLAALWKPGPQAPSAGKSQV